MNEQKYAEIIQAAREIGRKLQQSEAYLNLEIARQNSDDDAALQDMIGKFNLIRMDINNEASKEDRDDERLRNLNMDLRHLYADIMKNENMSAYNTAKQSFEEVSNAVRSIITQCAQGMDPDTADYSPSCGGDCSSCGGCH